MDSVIYGVSVYDVPTILIVVLTLAGVTFVATVAPALKIARIDPAKTLRED
jgi:ABC-type lipoprotein release transport system permease subunit